MNILHDLSTVLNRYCVRNVNVVGSGVNRDLVEDYYHLLQDDPTLSDDDCAERLYGSGTSSKDNRFRKLKNRLIRRMSNTLFFIDTKDSKMTDQQRAYYVSHRQFALAKILTGRNVQSASAYFLKKVFKRAVKYEMTELMMMSADSLRYYYGTYQLDKAKYAIYKKEYLRARKLYLAESQVTMYFEEVFANYDATPKGRQKTLELVTETLEKIEVDFGNLEMTYRFAFVYFFLKLTRAQTSGDYASVINIADEGVRFYQSKAYAALVPMVNMHMYRLMAHVQMRDFPSGRQALEVAYSIVQPDSPTQLKLYELEFMLGMHTERYTDALATYLKLATAHKLASLKARNGAVWQINRAYLYYLDALGEIDIDPEGDPWGRFRVSSFLNNVPEFSNEKRGMNIPILILQSLFAIVQKKYNTSIDRIEAIEKYCSRYVRRDDHFRSNCFIKALLQFPIASFHRKAVERKAAPYLVKLATQPLGMADQSYEIEVIPYDVLWPLAVASLEDKFQRTKRPKAKVKL